MTETCKSCGLPIAENAISFALLSKEQDQFFRCMKCEGKVHYTCLREDKPYGWCKMCKAESALGGTPGEAPKCGWCDQRIVLLDETYHCPKCGVILHADCVKPPQIQPGDDVIEHSRDWTCKACRAEATLT